MARLNSGHRFLILSSLWWWIQPNVNCYTSSLTTSTRSLSSLANQPLPWQGGKPIVRMVTTTIRRPLSQASSSLSPGTSTSSSSSSSYIMERSNHQRRQILRRLLFRPQVFFVLGKASSTEALVTDETDKYADNWWTEGKGPADGASLPSQPSSSSSSSPSSVMDRSVSDEISIDIPIDDMKDKKKNGLGLELSEVEFRTNRRVYVKSIRPGSLAESFGIKPNWILVSVNGRSVERTDAAGVAMIVSRAVQEEGMEKSSPHLSLRFRDPAIFQDTLRTLGMNSNNGGAGAGAGTTSVTTQVAPAGDTTQTNYGDGSVRRGETVQSQDDQRLTVSQLVPPKLSCRRRAQVDDLMEISYVGQVVETGQVFDGSAVRINGQAIPGRANDVSIFFVLGKQPFGQFPPGWDVGLEGMCVGERRRLLVPPVLAYGSTGLPRRGIPPNATLQYDVTLVSLNGLATP